MDDLSNGGHTRQSSYRKHSNEKFSAAKITEALLASRGLIASAARLLGCTRQTIYAAIERHPNIKAVVSGERELLLDQADLKLQQAIEAGEGWAVRFFLVTQGQARGYVERPRAEVEDRTLHVIIQRDPHVSSSAQTKVIDAVPTIEHRERP